MTSKKEKMNPHNKEEEQSILDDAFKSFIDDMKPFVLSLSDKKDRQRIALWIKKLCGQVNKTLTERKNRNLYAQILFHMLRKGSIEGPFDEGPRPGPLLTLPAYMSRYLDKPLMLGLATVKEQQNHPDWIRGELPSSDSAFSEMVVKRNMQASSDWDSPSSPALIIRSSPNRNNNVLEKYQYPNESYSLEIAEQRDSHSKKQIQKTSTENETLDDSLEEGDVDFTIQENRWNPPPSPVRRRLDARLSNRKSKKKTGGFVDSQDTASRKVKLTSPPFSNGFDSKENEDRNSKEYEFQAKTKQIEARFAKKRLALQQELDQTVRKVLSRKNKELEEVKSHYRMKLTEFEDIVNQQDKKIARLTRELNSSLNKNDKEVAELQAIIQQNNINSEHELDRKVNEKIAEFEQEKFQMQKEHTQNIQELLDETTERLKNIENEYMQRVDSTAERVKDMESEIYQLKRNRDIYKKEIDDMNIEKEQLKEKLANISMDNENLVSKVKSMDRENSKLVEGYDKTLRELRRKTDSTIERMKKERSEAALKASEVISDLEAKMNQFKQSLQDSELQKKRELREMESTQKQEIIRAEVNYDKTVRNLKSDMEKLETELQNQLKNADQVNREKTTKIKHLEDQLKEQKRQAQIAIEDFKMQAEGNSRKTFQEMRQQIEKVESELKKSNHEKEMQNFTFKTEKDSLLANYEKQIADLRNGHEEEKIRFMRNAETELSSRMKDSEKQQELLKSSFQQAIKETDESHKAQREIDSKKILELEQTVRDLREEVIQANSLRKQQLVELGMLREEEKQNFLRQEEALTANYRSQIEQQRLALQKKHSAEMEDMLETTNAKLKEIEREYSLSSDKNQLIITQLQNQVTELTEKVSREQSQAQVRVFELSEKCETEKADIKKHHGNAIKSLNQDIEMHRTRSKQFEKRLHETQLQSEESISRLKLECEEKMRGLLPNAARNELEETIQALREQISVIQLRAMTLQEELDDRDELKFSFDKTEPELTSSRH